MSGSYLLDTNIIIGLFAHEQSILINFNQAGSAFVPSITIGELHYGAQKSGRVQQNLERINRFVTEVEILSCDAATATQYGVIKNQLRLKGKPLPENDIWIAAIALQYNLTLVSRDAHFQNIETLQVIRW